MYFTTLAGYFPGSEGLIAPGMHCSYVVKFTPDSLVNYEDQLMVHKCTCMHIVFCTALVYRIVGNFGEAFKEFCNLVIRLP